ncbi:MAG: hypothetical protein J5I99_04455 [Verrucomicrobia bacterium]|nr:hypothetical protein [Kiritimatiellia bacterium]MCO6400464.1 hypothetical protein [Verrucomicrobiota bacterium]
MTVRSLSIFSIILSACAALAQAELVSVPASFSAAFESNLATQEWERAYTDLKPEWRLPTGAALPLDLRLRDLESGISATLKAGVIYSVGDRQRWGGRDLGVDWVLLLDQATNVAPHTTLSIQLKSNQSRFLQLEVGPRVETDGGFLHTATSARRIARSLSETSEAIPTRLGAQGERASHSFGIVEAPPLTLLLGVNPTEPRLYQIITRPEESFFGIRFEVAVSPETKAFPGRAAFQCIFAAWPTAARTYALENATEIWRQLCPTPDSSPESADSSNEVASVATTRYPLIFSPRIRDAETHAPQTPWLLFALPNASPDPLLALEQTLTGPTVAELENFARDARVRITADSTAPGFTPEAVANGVRGHAADSTAPDEWRSENAPTNHFLHLDFPQPTAFSELNIVWPLDRGQAQTPRALHISGVTANNASNSIAQLEDLEPTPDTAIALPSTQLKRLIIQMPAGRGSPDLPNQFRVSELELR